MKAIWNDILIAESSEIILVEGNYYFPPSSVNSDLLNESDTHTSCYWKGSASYYSIIANGQINFDAAWCYANPKDKANHIKNYIAFWKGVQIIHE
jgi:uncharacterized protein (DUF427 family)